MSHNQIVHLPSSLSLLYHLKILNVSHNSLRTLSNIFWLSCSQLEELYLQGNDLQNLDDSLELANKISRLRLVVLNAAQNRIRQIPSFLISTVSLTYLNMSGNPLVDIDPDVANNPSSFLTFLRQSLKSNPSFSHFQNPVLYHLARNPSSHVVDSKLNQMPSIGASDEQAIFSRQVTNSKGATSSFCTNQKFTPPSENIPPPAEKLNPRLKFMNMKNIGSSVDVTRAPNVDKFGKDLTSSITSSSSSSSSTPPASSQSNIRTLKLSVDLTGKERKEKRILKKRDGNRTPGQIRKAQAVSFPVKEIPPASNDALCRSPGFFHIPQPIFSLPLVSPRVNSSLSNSGASRLDSVLTSSLSPPRLENSGGSGFDKAESNVDLVRLCDGWMKMKFDFRFPTHEYVCPSTQSTSNVGPIIPAEIPAPTHKTPDMESELASFFLRNIDTPFEDHVVRLFNIGIGSQFGYFFANCSHLNFFIQLEKPIYITIGCEPAEFPSSHNDADDNGHLGYLLLIRKANQDLFSLVEIPPKKKAKILVPRDAIKIIKNILEPSVRTFLHPIEHPEAIRIHLDSERKLALSNYKFGILYCPRGGCDEDTMYSSQGSNRFYDFLSILGEVVILRSWGNFAGGLDVKNDSTGRQSVFTRFFDFEIMFHVSTLLPLHPGDAQRLERKRHIGNDAVVIIYVEEGTFCPDVLYSKFIQILVVVRHVVRGGRDHYEVSVISKNEVGPSYPSSLQDALTLGDPRFRDAFLALLINCERAVLASVPKFSNLLEGTRVMVLRDMISTLTEVPKPKEKEDVASALDAQGRKYVFHFVLS